MLFFGSFAWILLISLQKSELDTAMCCLISYDLAKKVLLLSLLCFTCQAPGDALAFSVCLSVLRMFSKALLHAFHLRLKLYLGPLRADLSLSLCLLGSLLLSLASKRSLSLFVCQTLSL